MVVKYADNVVKGFATSLSIILSCFVSAYTFHDIDLSMVFILGSFIVISSVFMFGYNPPVSDVISRILSDSKL
jgi:UDP-sugar transporter A1/2/3